MLKLTMERVAASSYQWKNDDLHIPNAAVCTEVTSPAAVADRQRSRSEPFSGTGRARAVIDNGFLLDVRVEIHGALPALSSHCVKFENRLMAAEALEKASLHGEALSEYTAMLQMEGYIHQQATVKERIAE